jgi:toxin YoeB
VTWRLVYTQQVRSDGEKIAASNLQSSVEELLGILREEPFRSSTPYETLVGDLRGAYSRRINIQHRIVYQVFEGERVVKLVRLWTG